MKLKLKLLGIISSFIVFLLLFIFLVISLFVFLNKNKLEEHIDLFLKGLFKNWNIVFNDSSIKINLFPFYIKGENVEIYKDSTFYIYGYNVIFKFNYKRLPFLLKKNFDEAFILNTDSLNFKLYINTQGNNSSNPTLSFMRFFSYISTLDLNFNLYINNKKYLGIYNLIGYYSYIPKNSIKYILELKGNFESLKTKSSIRATSNNLDEEINMSIIFNNINITSTYSTYLVKPLEFFGGNIDGKVNITFEKIKNLNVNGILSLNDVNFSVDDSIIFRKTDGNILIDDNNFIFKNFSLLHGDIKKPDTLKLYGKFNLDSIKYKFFLNEKDANINNHFIFKFFPQIKMVDNGKIDFSLYIDNQKMNFDFKGKNTIFMDTTSIEKFSGVGSYSFIKKDLNVITKFYRKNRIYGYFLFEMDSSLNWKIDITLKKFFSYLKLFNIIFYTEVKNSKISIYSNFDINGYGRFYKFKYGNIVFKKPNSKFSLYKKGNLINFYIPYLANIKTNIIDTNLIKVYGTFNNIALDMAFKTPKLFGKGKSNFTMYIEDDSIYNIKANLSGKYDDRKLFWYYSNLKINGVINDYGYKFKILSDSTNIFVNNYLYKIDFLLNVDTNNIILSYLNYKDEVFAKGVIFNLQSDTNNINFNLRFNNFKLVYKDEDYPFKVNLKGEIIVTGSLDSPFVRTYLTLDKIKFKDIPKNFKTYINLVYTKDSLYLGYPLDIFYDKYSILKISNLKLKNKKLYLIIKKHKLNLKVLNSLVGLTLGGKLNYILSLNSYYKDKILELKDNIKGNLKILGSNIKIEKTYLNNIKIIGKITPNFIIFNNINTISKKLKIYANGKYPLVDNRNLVLHLIGKGELLKEFNKYIPAFSKVENENSVLFINIHTHNDSLYINGSGNLYVDNIYMYNLIPNIKNVKGKIDIVNNKVKFNITTNVSKKDTIYIFNSFNKFYTHLKLENILDFGIINIKTSKKGIPVHFSLFQDKHDKGKIYIAGKDSLKYFSILGPLEAPTIKGKIYIENTKFTFPPPESYYENYNNDSLSNSDDNDFVYRVKYDLYVKPKSNVIYYFKSRKYLKGKEIIKAKIDETSYIIVKGNYYTLRLYGEVTSTLNGRIFYGKYFTIERITLEFIPEKLYDGTYNNIPIISGKAFYIAKSSNNTSRKIELIIKVKEEGDEYYRTRGRPGEIKFELSDPALLDIRDYESVQKEIFSSIFGINPEEVGNKEESVKLTAQTIELGEDYFVDRYINSWLNRYLKLPFIDFLDFRSRLFSNYYTYYTDKDLLNKNFVSLLRGTSFGFGTYLGNRLFLNYSGILEESTTDKLKLIHSLGIEYNINPMVQLNFKINYDPTLNTYLPYTSYGIILNIPLKMKGDK